MSRNLRLIGLLAVLTLSSGVSAGAQPPEPQLTVETPLVTCVGEGSNDLEVFATVTTNVDLDGLWVGIGRWEEIKAPPFYFPGQLEHVEWYSADIDDPSNPEHTLKTTDATTWNFHGYVSPDDYNYVSEVWTVSVAARAFVRGIHVWDEFHGMYDCSLPDPDWVTHEWPEWFDEKGEL